MKLSPYVLLLSSFTFIILFSYCYCYKNTLAQIHTQDLVYQPPLFGIKINYPSDWKANSDESDPNAEKTTIVTFSPKINSNVTDGAVKVWVDNNPRTNNLALYLQKELDNNKKNIANYTDSGSSVDSSLSGYPAFSYSYTTKVNGKDIQYLVAGTLINGKVYEITYLAQTDKFFVNDFNAHRIISSFVVVPSSLSSPPPGVDSGRPSNNISVISDVFNPQPLNNNISIVNHPNNIKDNQLGGTGTPDGNAGKGNIGNTTTTTNTNTNTSNSQPAGAIGLQTNNQSNLGLPNNHPDIPTSNPTVPTVPVNIQPPVANAGSNQEVNEGYIVLLNGSKSYDPSGDPITFSWRQIQGPAVKLDDTTSATPSFTSPNVSADTNLVFELTVKDNNGLKSNSIVAVTVKHNVPATTTSSTNLTTSSSNKSQPQLSQSPLIPSSTNAPQGYLTYTNPNYGISLNYKSDWTKQEGKGMLQADSCDGCNDIVTIIPTELLNLDYLPVIFSVSSFQYSSPVSVSEAGNDEIGASKSLKHYHLIISNTSSSLSGQPAYTIEYSWDFKNKKKVIPVHGLETGTMVGNNLYFIRYEADSDKYNTYLPIVQNMIKSFKILNPR